MLVLWSGSSRMIGFCGMCRVLQTTCRRILCKDTTRMSSRMLEDCLILGPEYSLSLLSDEALCSCASKSGTGYSSTRYAVQFHTSLLLRCSDVSHHLVRGEPIRIKKPETHSGLKG